MKTLQYQLSSMLTSGCYYIAQTTLPGSGSVTVSSDTILCDCASTRASLSLSYCKTTL